MEADGSSMLAQRAVEDSPRWTRAVEDPSAPIPERDMRGNSQTHGPDGISIVGDHLLP